MENTKNPIDELMNSHNLSMGQLCLLTGLTDTYLYKLRRGMAKTMNESLLKIFEKFGIPTEKAKDLYYQWKQSAIESIMKNYQ